MERSSLVTDTPAPKSKTAENEKSGYSPRRTPSPTSKPQALLYAQIKENGIRDQIKGYYVLSSRVEELAELKGKVRVSGVGKHSSQSNPESKGKSDSTEEGSDQLALAFTSLSTDAQKDTSVLMPTSHELMIWITRIRREQRKDSLNPRSAENFLFILYEIVEEWDWPLFLSLINGSNRIVFSQPGYRIVIENGALP
ncbi:hypothetical protein V6N12_075965 [Hibiscus sabdariffa]|uniref:Uncharacterized protein n=1 Tax=Hibiscus sabdariffa TaxID=183260 RepID=A0ABR2AXW2_9ROSI